MERTIITGAAGFIGFHLSMKLLEGGRRVIGIDNLNDYYDVNLKKNRLRLLQNKEGFTFIQGDVSSSAIVQKLFELQNYGSVIHLAA